MTKTEKVERASRRRRERSSRYDPMMEKRTRSDGTLKSEKELQFEKSLEEKTQHEAIVRLFEKKKGYNNRMGSIR